MGFPGKGFETTKGEIRNHWVLFFLDANERPWFQKFGITKRGFEHVFAVQYNPHGSTFILMDWTYTGLDIVVIDSIDLHHLSAWAKENNATVVNYEVQRQDLTKKPLRLLPMSCVLFLLHSLKLNTCRVYTPYQLYKYLINNGGKEHG